MGSFGVRYFQHPTNGADNLNPFDSPGCVLSRARHEGHAWGAHPKRPPRAGRVGIARGLWERTMIAAWSSLSLSLRSRVVANARAGQPQSKCIPHVVIHVFCMYYTCIIVHDANTGQPKRRDFVTRRCVRARMSKNVGARCCTATGHTVRASRTSNARR